MKGTETMAAKNDTKARRENGSSSSFLEVSGDVTIKTDATFSSTIRDMLVDTDRGLEPAMPVITEEQEHLYNTLDDGFTEACASCLTRDYSRQKATHFCRGCDRRGRYMCLKCLKDHTLWCKGPEHEVESLSVDRHSDPDYRYNTIKQPEESLPKPCPPRALPVPPENEYVNSWLHKNSTDSNSMKSEDTSNPSREKGQNITEHDIASSHGLSSSDNLTFSDGIPTVHHRPKPGRCISPISERTYDDVNSSHIYCDPITMLPVAAIPTPQRNKYNQSSWGDISTATARRLNVVYNDHNPPDRLAELTRARRNGSMERIHKKNKKCVIQ